MLIKTSPYIKSYPIILNRGYINRSYSSSGVKVTSSSNRVMHEALIFSFFLLLKRSLPFASNFIFNKSLPYFPSTSSVLKYLTAFSMCTLADRIPGIVNSLVTAFSFVFYFSGM